MNPDTELEISEENSDELDLDAVDSVEDFFRELEAKEKDLDISPDLVVEVEDSEFDERKIPDFVLDEVAQPRPKGSPAKPSAAQSSAITDFARRAEITRLEETVEKFKAERIEILERSKRQQDDFDNYRRRVERERIETYTGQMTNLAVHILPVLDNLNRAMDAAKAMPEAKRVEISEFLDGIVLVNQQVADVLAAMGVEPIPAVGREFDPTLHEAVTTDNSGTSEPNTVTEEMLRGYRVGDRVIRHSLVKVAAAPAGVGET
jgi:molecular chaperone GrpE